MPASASPAGRPSAPSSGGPSQVVVGYVGDGGINTGRTWESINLATVWKVPLIVICENNLYAVETLTSDLMSSASVVERAAGFGIHAEAIDGQDITAVRSAVLAAAERARAGEGPTFLEARTYRYAGHSTGQAITYRTDDEVAAWRNGRDPITRLCDALIAIGALDVAGFEAIEAEIAAEIDAAIVYAEAAPWPLPADVGRGVTVHGESVRRLA